MESRRLPVALLVALALAWFGPLFVAARAYPSGYDWRHDVVSNLANPRDNPKSWRIAADGMAVTGIFLALLSLEVRRRLRPLAPAWSNAAAAFLVLGGALLTVSALILPGHHAFFGIGKAHAKIAQAAGIALGLAMACTLPALLRLQRSHARVRAAAVGLVVIPITLFLLCHFLTPVAEAHAPPDQRDAIHHSLPASLAFWEWTGSVAVFGFLALVTLALPSDPSRPGP